MKKNTEEKIIRSIIWNVLTTQLLASCWDSLISFYWVTLNVCSFFSFYVVVSVYLYVEGVLLYDHLLERNSNMFVYVVIYTTFSWFTCIIHTIFSLFLKHTFLALALFISLIYRLHVWTKACFILFTRYSLSHKHTYTKHPQHPFASVFSFFFAWWLPTML